MKNTLITILSLSLLLLFSCEKNGGDKIEQGDYPSLAVAYAQTLGIGWNLGNSLDAHNGGVSGEKCWGNDPSTQATFDAVKAMGFSSVRIPVTYLGHIGTAPDYTIGKAWLDRVAEVAGYAKKAGLKAIINIHHDGADSKYWLNLLASSTDPTRNAVVEEMITKIWSQIATRFKNEGDWLIFETFNEVHDGDWGNGASSTDGGAQYRLLNRWNQVALDAIRATGGKNATRYVGIPGYAANPGLTLKYLELPKDSVEGKLMVSVHCYDPWEFAGKGNLETWGHNGVGLPSNCSEAALVETMGKLATKYVKKGIPVYIGEFGCVRHSSATGEAFRKYYLEYFCKAMKVYNIVGMVWDNGSSASGDDAFGLLNHGTGEFILDSEIFVRTMIDAWKNDNPYYTLEGIYNKSPKVN